MSLSRELDGSRLSDYDDLDLAGVIQFLFQFAGNIVCEFGSPFIIDLGVTHHDPDFTARLKWSPNETVVHRGAFAVLDLGLVARVVLSLFVVLLIYDTVCGEKEAGTLRLVSSFAVSRSEFLVSSAVA